MSEKEIGAFPPIPEKRFFTIGEAAELVGVATSVLRFWEDEFKQLSPGRHGSRRRYEKKIFSRRVRFARSSMTRAIRLPALRSI